VKSNHTENARGPDKRFPGLRADMELYDCLPLEVKRALQQCVCKYSGNSVYNVFCGWGLTQTIHGILMAEQENLVFAREKIWGKDYPEFKKGVRS